MFENFKNKIVNGKDIEEKYIDYQLKDVIVTLNNHSIEFDKFVDLFEKIELRTSFDTFSGFIGTVNNSGKKIWFGGILIDFVNKVSIDEYDCYSFEVDKRTLIDQINEIHNLLNDGIVEKYEYKVNWLKNSKKLVNLIETYNSRTYGLLTGVANKKDIENNIKLVEFIDEKLGIIVNNLKLNKDIVKNKFNILNKDCFVNGNNETKVQLKLSDCNLIVKFKGFNYNDECSYKKKWYMVLMN